MTEPTVRIYMDVPISELDLDRCSVYEPRHQDPYDPGFDVTIEMVTWEPGDTDPREVEIDENYMYIVEERLIDWHQSRAED